MNPTNAPPPADCTCLTLAGRMRAELEQRDVPLCPRHQPAEVQRLAAEADVADAHRHAEVLRDVLTEPDPPCACPPLAARLSADLTGTALPDCPAHATEAAPPAPSNVVPLNARPSAYESLRPYLSTDPSNPNDDGPTAA